MLLTEAQSTLIAWGIGGFLMAVGAFGAWWMYREERRGPGAAFLILIFLGYAVGVSKFANGTRVLIMKGDDAGFVRSDLRLYGGSTYTYASGRSEAFWWLDARHIIINDTPRALKLRTVRYGYGASFERPILPGQSLAVAGIVRHFGPGDVPPASIDTGEPERNWLYW